ncbi:S41 family peptidase [Alkaliphilus peptidifermentans]|uniref:Carboxyl-terminal processing protease n=1 Tax=Alkaliphilus peptidifermentans DSM 18978 TaxID=1120976 RepID=A0A1G5AIS2_9FIRM|nr:S41 family peptidase [Alkaliphilus peptidifermentans]SCX77798.1 carboxyl-terminal processing protease [Alkaliphilus peptidifermentans DSM 18978]
MTRPSNWKKQLAVIAAMVMVMVFLTTPFTYADDYGDYILEGLKDVILQKFVDPLKYEDLKGDTPQEIFDNLDIHSEYYTREEFDAFLDQIMGEFSGIGAYIEEKEGKVYIDETIDDSPAKKAGLKAGDEIYTVDSIPTKGMTVQEAVNLIRGEEGTKVTLEIKRAGIDKILKYTITRAVIESNPIQWETIDGIGYIKIDSFNEKASNNFSKAVTNMKEEKIDKIIVDVRDNPGGSLDEVVNISRLLVPKGPVVFVDFRSYKLTYSSFLSKPIFEDIVVLTSEGSASASEILAAAVQDTKAGVVVGKTTYGKGSVQRLYGMFNGDGYKITEARYLSPNKTIIDGVGVIPDYEVERYPEEFHVEKLLPLSLVETLNKEDNNDTVLAIQQRLRIIGYEITDEDGWYGESTQKAVEAFAKGHGIKTTQLTPEMQFDIDFVFRLTVSNKKMTNSYNLHWTTLKIKILKQQQ